MAKKYSDVEICRRWVVSLTYHDGREITTTAYGPNATAAESAVMCDKNVKTAVVRSEIR